MPVPGCPSALNLSKDIKGFLSESNIALPDGDAVLVQSCRQMPAIKYKGVLKA